MKFIEAIKTNFAKLNLTSAIILIMTVCLISFGIVTSYHSLTTILKQKKLDTWTIYYQELESHALNISKVIDRRILRNSTVVPTARAFKEYYREPDVILRFKDQKNLISLKGPFDDLIKLKSLGIPSHKLEKKWTFTGTTHGIIAFRTFSQKGMKYDIGFEAAKKGVYLVGWKLPIDKILSSRFLNNKQSLVYIVNMSGHLIFANHHKLTSQGILNRSIVRQYISSSFRSGQLEFYDEESDTEYFGLFLEIPNTNLIIFSESDKNIILSVVKKLGFHFLMVICNFMLIAIILTYLFLENILKPLQPLVKAAEEVGEGNFSVKVPNSGVGEFNLLADAFNGMTESLVLRDEKIEYLAVEEEKKKVLKKELDFARTVQKTLLPSESLPKISGLRVDSCYVPAGSVSGDWYSHFYDEKTGDTIVIMIDVSGHGAGSGLLTAMAVGIFETFHRSYSGDPALLLKLINIALFTKARQEAHATMLLLRYNKESNKASLYNMGHQFPFVVNCQGESIKCKRIKMPSDYGGMSENSTIYETQIDFNVNDRIFMFTDGLIEFQGIDTKPIRTKDVQKALLKDVENKEGVLINQLFSEWKKRLGNNEVPDDLCMLLITAI